MNKQNKAYSIILFLIWPFSALYIGLRNFDTFFGRNLIIVLYSFLGLTAFSVGDLDRYEKQFYIYKAVSISKLFTDFISLQDGKFYNSFLSIVTGFVFQSHHFYFMFLFLVYGNFYVKAIFLLKDITFKKNNFFRLIFFLGLFMFLMVRSIPNLAFYTGGVFIVYNMICYYKFQQKKYLWFLFLAPLFHIGLTIYILVPLLLFLFKNKTWLYISFVFVTFLIGKSTIVGYLENLSESNSGTIIESKYNAYASDEGQESLEKRYAENEKIYNSKLKILNFFQDAVLYFFVPLGMIVLFFNRKRLFQNENLRYFFHIVLLFYGISNIMMNISQGARFLVLFSFIAIGLFFTVYSKTKHIENYFIFNIFCKVFAPFIFIFGLMSAYASNEMFTYSFFVSNFFIEIINYLL